MSVEVDGGEGEGGGQILRGAIALACITSKPTRVFSIRANRPNPGLQPQHMLGIEAAARVAGGRVDGLTIGSTEVRFTPGRIMAGKYAFDVKTAGSMTLIMQTLLPILTFAEGESEVALSGGTDVPWSPPIDYVKHVLLPYLGCFGVQAWVEVQRRGYYPKGGGQSILRVKGTEGLTSICFIERGKVESVRGISHCANLPTHVARRQAETAKRVLLSAGLENVRIAEESAMAAGLGSGITLWANAGDKIRLGGDALGTREKRAEEVGREAAENLVREVKSGMAADSHFGDMALLYMALAKGNSELGVSMLSRHAETMVLLCKKFVEADWDVERRDGGSAVLRVEGAGMASQGAARG
jgi:RNA 3'-terminal phosphate cyclase (ATP)